MLNLTPRRCEVLSDCVLGLLVVLPPIAMIGLLFDCSPLDGREVRCSSPFLETFANTLQGLMLLTAFGGFILYLPIVVAAYINSTRYKVRAWKAGTLRKWSLTFIVWLLTSCFIGLVVAAIVLELVLDLMNVRPDLEP